MSNLRDFERSSCAVTAPESASSVATLAAVQDPAGRNSSTSPDAVAVSCGAVAKIRIPHQVEYAPSSPRHCLRIDLRQEGSRSEPTVDANQLLRRGPT